MGWLMMRREQFTEYLERASKGEDPKALLVEFLKEREK